MDSSDLGQIIFATFAKTLGSFRLHKTREIHWLAAMIWTQLGLRSIASA